MRARELPRAVAAIRTMLASGDVNVDERITAIYEAEQERVANAAVLAELLAPMLARQLAPVQAVGAETEKRVDEPAKGGDSDGADVGYESSGVVKPKATDIAGFIDEMLAQERSQSVPRRRAS